MIRLLLQEFTRSLPSVTSGVKSQLPRVSTLESYDILVGIHSGDKQHPNFVENIRFDSVKFKIAAFWEFYSSRPGLDPYQILRLEDENPEQNTSTGKLYLSPSMFSCLYTNTK